MNPHYDRLVLAYHGTNKKAATQLLQGRPFRASENEYDWLGHGIYFWEHGIDRALEWAVKAHGRRSAAVVGALIQTGRCYDLMDTRYTRDLKRGAAAFHEFSSAAGLPIPENRERRRALDCAVLNWWMAQVERTEDRVFQTVRRGFEEGNPIYPGMLITERSHVQIVVRDPSCIVGVFSPRAWSASTADTAL